MQCLPRNPNRHDRSHKFQLCDLRDGLDRNHYESIDPQCALPDSRSPDGWPAVRNLHHLQDHGFNEWQVGHQQWIHLLEVHRCDVLERGHRFSQPEDGECHDRDLLLEQQRTE